MEEPVSGNEQIREAATQNTQVIEDREECVSGEDSGVQCEYGAQHVIQLFIPVSLCMTLVVFSVKTVAYYTRKDGQYLFYTPFVKKTDSAGEHLMMSIGNAIVFLCVVATMTFVLIILYKTRCYKIIHGWLTVSSLILLSLFTTTYLQELFRSLNVAVDIITIVFIVWNYVVLGMVCIHWKGPLRLQQGYLIVMSALMALIFLKLLPDWTVWTVLAVISVWDLVAVLCPKGPLRILVETAQERNEPIFPALIYSAGIVYAYTAVSNDSDGDSNTNPSSISSGMHDGLNGEQSVSNATPSTASTNAQEESSNSGARAVSSTVQLTQSTSTDLIPDVIVRRYAPLRATPKAARSSIQGRSMVTGEPAFDISSPATLRDSSVSSRRRLVSDVAASSSTSTANGPNRLHPVRREEEKGVKLGLGDFIFYSILIGKASSYDDWNTTIACYLAILIGLCFTLTLLAITRKALPALPISIFAGLLVYFITSEIVTPFCMELSMQQILL